MEQANIAETLETLQNKPSNLHLAPRNSYLNNRNRVIAPRYYFFCSELTVHELLLKSELSQPRKLAF